MFIRFFLSLRDIRRSVQEVNVQTVERAAAGRTRPMKKRPRSNVMSFALNGEGKKFLFFLTFIREI